VTAVSVGQNTARSVLNKGERLCLDAIALKSVS
jgi:hypothetical protein